MLSADLQHSSCGGTADHHGPRAPGHAPPPPLLRAGGGGGVAFVNEIAFPTEVLSHIPRYWRRFPTDTFVLQVFVDVFQDPPRPLRLIAAEAAAAPSSPTAGTSTAPCKGATSVDVITAAQAAAGARTPRGPYLVRIPCDTTVGEATSHARHVLEAAQQQERRAQAEPSHAPNADTARQQKRQRHRSPPAPPGEQSSLRGEKRHDSRRAAKRRVALADVLGPDDAASRTLASLPDLSTCGPLLLRPCDGLGRALAFDVALLSEDEPVLRQLQRGGDAAGHRLCLAPDPVAFRCSLRERRLAGHAAREAQAAALNAHRDARVEALNDARRAAAAAAMEQSARRDVVVRGQMRRPIATTEVRLWRRGALLEAKRRDAAIAAEERAREVAQRAEACHAQMKALLRREIDLIDECDAVAAQLAQEERNARAALGAEKAAVERALRSNVRRWLRELPAAVDRVVMAGAASDDGERLFA